MIQTDTKAIANLENVHPDLIALITEISAYIPLRVLCGSRDQTAQDAAVKAGYSKTPWPLSKHNHNPSRAVDICIHPYNPDDHLQLLYMNAFVMGFGTARGLKLRSGADWNWNFSPSTSPPPKDYFHIELLD